MRWGWLWFCAGGFGFIGACSSGGAGGSGTGGGGTCLGVGGVKCSTASACPGLICQCPGTKFAATIKSCLGSCCARDCDEACGISGSGGAGTGGSAAGGFGAFGAFGGTGGSSGAAGADAGGSAGMGASAGSGGSGGFVDAGPTPATSDVHVLFMDAAAQSGAYYGILRHGVKAKGSTTWTLSIVDSGLSASSGSTFAMQELVLDAAGLPNVAYMHQRTKTLRFTRWDGNAWVQMNGAFGYDVLDSNVDTVGAGKHFITMHGGKPELVFRQGTTLKRYSWSGSQWQGSVVLDTTPPTGVANPGGAPALTFDSSGYAHVAHHDHGGYQLHYARDGASGWSNELLAFSPKQSGAYKHIVLDAALHANIVFKFGFTRWSGSNWVKADGTAGFDAFDTEFIASTLSPQSELLVGHRVGSGIELVKKPLNGGAWQTLGQVHPGPHSGAAFAGDTSGTIHAVVSEGTLNNNELVHLQQSTGGWLRESIYAQGGTSRLIQPSLAIQ